MSDRPWLEDNDPSLRTERALLKRLNSAQPPAGSIDHGWAALAAEIAVLPTIGASVPTAAHVAAHAAKSSLGLGLGAKVAVGVIVAGGALWTGNALLKPAAPGPSESASHHPSAPAESPTERAQQAPNAKPEVSADPDANELPAKPLPAPRPASSATTLAEEGRLLARANQLVQAGQAQQALEVLRVSASRYPRSVLYQEREVLTIEALAATGASSAAKSRAQRFLKRYPSSPHIGRLQRFVE